MWLTSLLFLTWYARSQTVEANEKFRQQTFLVDVNGDSVDEIGFVDMIAPTTVTVIVVEATALLHSLFLFNVSISHSLEHVFIVASPDRLFANESLICLDDLKDLQCLSLTPIGVLTVSRLKQESFLLKTDRAVSDVFSKLYVLHPFVQSALDTWEWSHRSGVWQFVQSAHLPLPVDATEEMHGLFFQYPETVLIVLHGRTLSLSLEHSLHWRSHPHALPHRGNFSLLAILHPFSICLSRSETEKDEDWTPLFGNNPSECAQQQKQFAQHLHHGRIENIFFSGPAHSPRSLILFNAPHNNNTHLAYFLDQKWQWTQAMPQLLQDQDGDGLSTGAEMGLYLEPLHHYGASAFAQDVFVHIDWMMSPRQGPNLKPTDRARELAVSEFADAGINLHLVMGSAVPFVDNLGDSDPSLNWSLHFDPIKAASFPSTRKGLFHYCLFANRHNGGTVSGRSRSIPGTDFLITLGSWVLDEPSLSFVQAGTLLHGLGHNLNLRHGGSDNANWKPNHLSIMNYLYQMRGVWVNGVRRLVFSSLTCAALDETRLLETVGLSCVPNQIRAEKILTDRRGPKVRADFFHNEKHSLVDLNQPLDLNGDGLISKEPLELDLNFDQKQTVLTSIPNEYALLELNVFAPKNTPFGSSIEGSSMQGLPIEEKSKPTQHQVVHDPLIEPSFLVFSSLPKTIVTSSNQFFMVSQDKPFLEITPATKQRLDPKFALSRLQQVNRHGIAACLNT